ncbi:MAG TPA: L,D-transpeptidase family protein [Candidatus Binataceae bacterium]|nr:L,D-transpeptidase family protein [Candidatus Binataceae bacterium]
MIAFPSRLGRMVLMVGFGVGVLMAQALAAAPIPPPRAQALSPAGQKMLAELIASGQIAEMYRPDLRSFEAPLRTFYQSGDNTLAWVRDGQVTPQATALVAVFVQAEREGLEPADYDGPRWSDRFQRLPRADEAELVRFDVALTACAMRYIRDLRVGRVNPQALKFGLDPSANEIDMAAFLRTRVVLAEPATIAPAMSALEPPFWAYRRTLAALQTYERLAKSDDGQTLPIPAKSVEPGQPYAGLTGLVRRLRLVGDLPADAVVKTAPPIYQEPLVTAVKSYQRRHGLDIDGRLGRATLEQLNVPLSWRVEQLRLSLERWRWVPQTYAQPPLIVNIPEFMLRCWNKDYRNVLQMRVVVGRSYRHKTPVFAEPMRYLVFRPYWNVPLSIQRAELVPKLARNPNYLSEHGYEVVDRSGAIITGAMDGAILAGIRSGKLSVRQRPGPKNALGLVKFIFPNSYSVYLHSTPAVALFARRRRDFSHGCIRVQDPVSLAVWVLRHNPGNWDRTHVLAAMEGERDSYQVNLAQPLPVLIVYTTAFVLRSGEVRFFNDIYGYDLELERALSNGVPTR